MWQFLPTGPTSPVFDNSPYMTVSAFAGSPLLISLELLADDGLLDKEYLSPPSFSEYVTEYSQVMLLKSHLLHRAFKQFNLQEKSFVQFKKSNDWLFDYCLFMALKETYHQKGWFDWPPNLASRKKNALQKATVTHSKTMSYYAFEQFIFHKQWKLLKNRAKDKNILLVGDIPIYVGWDSVDVWANQSIFELSTKTFSPLNVAGVPPDYFSTTGQRWGNPLYRWNSKDKNVQKKLHEWWIERFRAVFSRVDIARVDHFRGFEAYWSIPEKEKTAINGRWLKGPGKTFFKNVFDRLGSLPIIAEDLGEITPEVVKLRDTFGFPGMKILQFAFDNNRTNEFLPYNYKTTNSVVYTGTHDNNTTVGWFLSKQLNDAQRKEIKSICNQTNDDASSIHRDMIYLALSSISNYAILPLQDIFGFGNDCKMNSPGSKKGNWAWRCAPRFLTDEVAGWLYQQCELFGRVAPTTTETIKTKSDKLVKSKIVDD